MDLKVGDVVLYKAIEHKIVADKETPVVDLYGHNLFPHVGFDFVIIPTKIEIEEFKPFVHVNGFELRINYSF